LTDIDTEAVVVGSGPNGLAAAIALAQAGRSVTVVEADDEIGGGTRSADLTLPGFTHDVCSAIHPLVLASPFFSTLPLAEHGLELVHPEFPLAQPLDGGDAVLLSRSVDETADRLGVDARGYRRLMGSLVEHADALIPELLGPFRIPRHPFALAGFGLKGLRSIVRLAHAYVPGERGSALLGGMAAHSMLSLRKIPTGAVALVLGMLAHAVGWPAARGGSRAITDALAGYLRSIGGAIVNGRPVGSVAEFPRARAIICDVTPRQLIELAGPELPARYRKALGRYRYGSGVFKIDWALDGPIPWTAQACAGAGTVHLGGTLQEMVAAEDEVISGRHPDRPYVLLAQQSMFDPSRAPAGKHTAWAYCHVPSGSTTDMTTAIEGQLERFAPGFRDRVLARSTINAKALEGYNQNYVGGDINGGVQDIWQHFSRPVARVNPYTTPNRRIFICSSSTPPGGGVHGMGGYFAARAALKRAF
jgi:phytoene dehydrogenase-like protein